MSCLMIKEFLDSTFSTVFQCREINGYIGVTTPFYYPDGDTIELFIHERNGKIVVSDLGETMRFLGSYDLDMKSYSKRQKILEEVVRSLNVSLMRGTLYLRIDSVEALPSAIFDLSQCVIRVCDLLYTVRGTGRAAFAEEVKDYLDFNKFKFEENYPVETASDHRYEFDFGVEVGNHVKLIELVNPPAKPTHRPNTDRLLRTWADLEYYAPEFPKTSRITLLDDSTYNWRDSDLLLLEKFSILTRWTDKLNFLSVLNSNVA